MKNDYALILKSDRIRPAGGAGTVLAESESDRSRILFSPAFRRLQQAAYTSSVNAHAATGGNFNHCLQVSQVGRSIANRIAAELDAQKYARPGECAALVNFVESACLLRNIGNPPFGGAGKAAIQTWFATRGADTIRTACKTYCGREIGASDPRMLQALADFYEFDGNPQGLRVIAKIRWSTEPQGLNLTKTSIAAYLKYLRMAGAEGTEPVEKFTEKAGFFSTEAGLVKSIWSEFGYSAAMPQRFPLAYIVDAAEKIAAFLCDLEDAIETKLLRQHEAIGAIKENWLHSYVPSGLDPTDDRIDAILDDGIAGKNRARDEFGCADFRAALVATLSDYAARRYVEQHDAVFAGMLDSLLPPESGAGTMLIALKNYCKQHVYRQQSAQHGDLAGYATIYGLLEHFSVLLECSNVRFKAALDHAIAQHAPGGTTFIEQKLLSLIPGQYLSVYSHAVAQIGSAHGRDSEFEEWNARAHLVVDYLAGMPDSFAVTTFRALSGMPL